MFRHPRNPFLSIRARATALGALVALAIGPGVVIAEPIDSGLGSEAPAVEPYEPLLEYANSLAVQGRFREAKDEFSRIARAQRADGILPTEAMWSLAQLHYGDLNVDRAAQVLSELATHAERMGYPAVQARALLESTILYHSIGRVDATKRGIHRLSVLRSSPSISTDMRAEIERRLALR